MRRSSVFLFIALLGGALPAAAQYREPIEAAREKVLLIRVRIDGTGHHVEEVRRLARVAKHGDSRSRSAQDTFAYTVTDAQGQVIAAGRSADPRVLRGPLPLPGEPPAGHAVARTRTGSFVIEVPDVAAVRYLRIDKAPTAAGKSRKLDAAVQVIDLAPSLAR